MAHRVITPDDRSGVQPKAWAKVVHHGGRSYVATATMADIFVAHARDVIARNETELVPLLHQGGVDLLVIGPETRFAIVDIEIGAAEAPLDDTQQAKPRRTAS
ncbi:MAG TPA: hypothetical protein VGC18_15515 [Lacisediminihabitans sp.]|uniref:hypothetical protein n=1 Tax=Lacisediminihabitans sp. TaxID=2787631 RepID=UPI002ED93F79